MAVGPGYFRPVGKRSTKDCAHRHVEKSDGPSPHISLSPENDWPTKAFSSLRWCQGHRFIPKSERERRNTAAKARSVFNAGRRCCHLQMMLPTWMVDLATSEGVLATSVATCLATSLP